MAINVSLLSFLFLLSSNLLCSLTSATSSHKCNPSMDATLSAPTPLINFLQPLQRAALDSFGPSGFDPKLYVDLPLRFGLEETERAFQELPRLSNQSVEARVLMEFIENYMEQAGSDLVYVEPSDFVPEPPGFLPNVGNLRVRKWALDVHGLWRNLSRKVSDEVGKKPEKHTLLPVPELGMLPGSRFREVYYWDSYWVIRGLLVSKMFDTAKGLVNNLISLIDTYGFVLNGARSYYTNRSQPPLLSAMIWEIYMRTGDLDFVKKSFPALLKEHKFWNSGFHKVIVQDAHGCNHTLSRYYAMWNNPRPESFTIDEASASKLPDTFAKQQFYREVASAAESGWDFSSRWMSDPTDLTTLRTTSILPVDLNTFILKMELHIAFFAKLLGEASISRDFIAASEARRTAIKTIFWNSEMGQWLDYWLGNSRCEDIHKMEAHNQNQNIFASNFIPLWGEVDSGESTEKVMKSLQNSGLLQVAGISTSLLNTTQQWDFPNGWAPLQHMIIEGLARSGSKEARTLARDMAYCWLRTNYVAFNKTGQMHEKYDVEACGEFGGGGEYTPQTGFGWTNGVALALLEEFGWPEDLNISCQ
ncbi:probable trehalase [Amborella trichopoda]|uniref:Trehalase n=1 Tax=Amborella trichopoda TaxID=13333 RepID=U5DFX5_AMBTC|nr:probable trehalase [Amborella trichopoda]ERN19328.1 hypothetical protein AMTR_s00069p00080510 [Amborella trichopoda]|eukprot:XP_006857861.1 probable trehalase [Amborella trichopoda]